MENISLENVVETARVDDKDWFLQMLVGMANDGIGIGVVLNVGGLLISGNICSGKNYFSKFGDEVGRAMHPNDQSAASELANTYKDIGEDIYSKSGSDSHPATFIHMDNAKVFSAKGDCIPSGDKGTLWRGKIADIDGFSLGVLSKN